MRSRKTKKDEAYRLIRDEIITGDLHAGDILNVTGLSEKFQVGITPVREALILLESDGFIEALPRVGYVITTVSVQDILEMFHLRTILEVEAIGLAVERISAAELQMLAENHAREVQLVRRENNSKRADAYRLNREFHLVIASASGNQRLARLVEHLIDDMERMLAIDPYIADPEQHRDVLECLKRRDKPGAQEAMRRHLENTRSRIVDRF